VEASGLVLKIVVTRRFGSLPNWPAPDAASTSSEVFAGQSYFEVVMRGAVHAMPETNRVSQIDDDGPRPTLITLAADASKE